MNLHEMNIYIYVYITNISIKIHIIETVKMNQAISVCYVSLMISVQIPSTHIKAGNSPVHLTSAPRVEIEDTDRQIPWRSLASQAVSTWFSERSCL